ncbi:NAD(P)-dependent oxidoreductase [Sphingobium phenoxybenzoativorans]|uniref:Dehydrogenase n=1 Tax=Sphingobium phenoxybenzoativorans TaxID=1592790 RepID=A0A1W5YR04_9SPHN|nr:NAD(P)-dependent oxidoreductase [Sphingobium phenoxybenzoativorans]ARI47601.1 dehydrogenase [Sphingobium phenoxybenzoativorans]
MSARQVIGFIGLGEQGAPLALNLIDAGYALVVFDLRAEAVGPLIQAGAKLASSIKEVGSLVDMVLVCVTDDAQLDAVLEGSGGLLAAMQAGGTVVILSTVSTALVAKVGDQTGKRGLNLLDAPLTGGPVGAREKRVVHFVGGEDDTLATCRAVLEVSAHKIIHAGPLGAGTRAKLVHQLVLIGNLAVAEGGWSLGRRAGLDDGVIREVLGGGMAQSIVAERLPELVPTDHITALFRKDLSLCQQVADELGVDIPGLDFAAAYLGETISGSD